MRKTQKRILTEGNLNQRNLMYRSHSSRLPSPHYSKNKNLPWTNYVDDYVLRQEYFLHQQHQIALNRVIKKDEKRVTMNWLLQDIWFKDHSTLLWILSKDWKHWQLNKGWVIKKEEYIEYLLPVHYSHKYPGKGITFHMLWELRILRGRF